MEKTLNKYSRRFDKNSINWTEDNMEQNRLFLKSELCYFDDLLRSRGYVFLRDIYEHLDLEPLDKESIVCGWYYDKDDPDLHPHIDVCFKEGLDGFDIVFNVDGEILSKFN